MPNRVTSAVVSTIPTAVRRIVQRLRTAGFEAFLVGGCVRDSLLGKNPVDYDVATSARPEQTQSLFRRSFPVGREFGVVLVREDGIEVQVATFRVEGDYHDGRHPGRVRYAHARADVLRRDFTVNGLFLDPVSGQVLDWVGGRRDLAAGVIRTIGRPAERFQEDHLRLLRAIRFAAQLGFGIERNTLRSIRRLAGLIGRVSAERVREELLKLLQMPHAVLGWKWLVVSCLAEELLPEVVSRWGGRQSVRAQAKGLASQPLSRRLRHLPSNASATLIWAAILLEAGDTSRPVRGSSQGSRMKGANSPANRSRIAERVLCRLKFPVRQRDAIVSCIRSQGQFTAVGRLNRFHLRRLVMRPGFPTALELYRADCRASNRTLDDAKRLEQACREVESRPDLSKPLLRGRDLVDLGLMPGPRVGWLLNRVRQMQLRDRLSDRKAALDWVRRHLAA